MPKKRVVILGGGISGLAAANRLHELCVRENMELEIVVVEGKKRFGGMIETERRDGFLLEGGPDSFLSEKPAAVELCKRLGLGDEILATRDEFRRSFIYFDRRLHAVPGGFYLIAPARWDALFGNPILSWPGKLRMACDLFIPPRRDDQDESVAHFVQRRFGREVLDRIGQPMIAGIYGANPQLLSLQATFPKFREMERGQGSVIRALMASGKKDAEIPVEEAGEASGPRYSLFVTLKSGMETLVNALTRVREINFLSQAPVRKIEAGESWKIHFEEGEDLEADAVCLALPAYEAARLVDSFADKLAKELRSIRYESLSTVNLAFRRRDVSHPLNGFGFVVPSRQKKKICACTFTSVKYAGRAPEDHVLLRAFIGGALQTGLLEADDAALEGAAREDLREILGIQAPPVLVSVRRYLKSMPQYYVGHLAKVKTILSESGRYPGLYLTGSAYAGVGLPDCVAHAEAQAEEIFQTLKKGESA